MDLRQLRYHLKAALSWLRLPILGGPLRGSWISVLCGMRFWRGNYDSDAIEVFAAGILPGDVVYDVGAHVGYYSMVAARRVHPGGRVYAFEPLPLNLRLLRGHLSVNGIDSVDVVAAGVDQHTGTATFDLGLGSGRGRVGDGGKLRIALVALDEWLLASGARPPTLIKMDVEGAEVRALQGARAIFMRHRPRLLLSVHTEPLRRDCVSLLKEYGYVIGSTGKPGQLLAEPGPVAMQAAGAAT